MNFLSAASLAAAATASLSSQQNRIQPKKDVQSHIPHSGCTTPDPRGYVLYLAFAQQFNNQLISVAESALLARKLGRILVLTGFLEQQSEKKASDGKDYYDDPRELKPFENVFHPTASFESVGVDTVTMATFMQLCPNQDQYENSFAEAHVFIPDWEPELAGIGGSHTYMTYNASFYLPQHMYECCQDKCCGPYSVPNTCSDCGQHGWKNRWDSQLAAPGIVPSFRETWQVAHGHSQTWELDKVPSGTDIPTIVVDGLYYKFNATNPRYAEGSAEVFETISHFKWNASIASRAKTEVSTRFLGRPYVALHWRRGFTGGAFEVRTIDEVIGLLKNKTDEIMGLGRAPPAIYLASNILSKAEVKQIMGQLQEGQEVSSLVLDSPSDLDLNALSRVEMAICMGAEEFIPAPGSTWSMNVQALRGTQPEHFAQVAKALDERHANGRGDVVRAVGQRPPAPFYGEKAKHMEQMP